MEIPSEDSRDCGDVSMDVIGAGAPHGDGEMRPTKSVQIDGRFANPWPTWKGFPSAGSFIKYSACVKLRQAAPKKSEVEQNLPVTFPDPSSDLLNSPPAPGQPIRYVWIGHASMLVQLDGVSVLTDPIFSERCSFVQFIGPKRYRPPALTVETLPESLNAVVISHNHYDHLDWTSVKALNERYGTALQWFAPLGVGDWLKNTAGCENVVTLDWWEEGFVKGSEVKVVCTPCQHWSQRGLTDRCKTLWSSWAVVGPTKKFFFGGDTAYCSVFKEIGQKFDGFDLSAIPIGAYKPRYLMQCQHVDPAEAVQIHQDIRSKISVGIHWGTFDMGALEEYLEPKETLREEVEKAGLDPDKDFITVNHGQICTVE